MPFTRDAALARTAPTTTMERGNNPACDHVSVLRSHWDGTVTEWCASCGARVDYFVGQ